MKHEGDNDTNCYWNIRNVPSKSEKDTGGIGDQWKNRSHSDHSTNKIRRNSKKSHGIPKRLAVIQILVKSHSLKLVGKSRKMYNNNNNNSVGELNIVGSFGRSFWESCDHLVMWHFKKRVLALFDTRHQTEKTSLLYSLLRPAHACKFIPRWLFPYTRKM